MTAAVIFLMCWTALKLAGGTPTGRILHRFMVDLPAIAASRVSRGHVTLAIIVLVLIALHLNAGSNDPVRMIGLAAPELALWLTSLEIGWVIEAVTFVVAAWTAIRGTNGWRVTANLARRCARRSRGETKRTRRNRRCACPAPANDEDEDEDDGAWRNGARMQRAAFRIGGIGS